MPTRKDIFDNHNFQQYRHDINKALEELNIPPSSSSEINAGHRRLKKALKYVDGLITSADIDLVPISTWNNLQAPYSQILTILNSRLQLNNPTNIQNANTYADKLIQQLAPFVISGKGAAQALGRALSNQAKTVEKYTETLESSLATKISDATEIKAKLDKLLNQIEGIEEKITNYEDELFSDDEDSESTKTKISNLVNELNKIKGDITGFQKKLVGKDEDDENSIIYDVSSTQAKVSSAKESAEKQLGVLTRKLSELSSLYDDVYGKENEDGKLIGGLKAEYNAQKQATTALKNEIEGLLPDATVAGLASAYAEQKKEYSGPVSAFQRVFYASVAILFIIGVTALLSWSEQSGFVWGLPKQWEFLTMPFSRLPLAAPIIWLAYYSSKRRNENRRLEEEYAHKEAMAKSYHAFKKQIDKLGAENTDQLSAKLLEATIDAISYNASETLDRNHDDKLPNIDQLTTFQKMFHQVQTMFSRDGVG